MHKVTLIWCYTIREKTVNLKFDNSDEQSQDILALFEDNSDEYCTDERLGDEEMWCLRQLNKLTGYVLCCRSH